MPATAARRARRAARHASRALRRRKVPAAFAALAAATVLAMGGAGFVVDADHGGGPARSGHMMMMEHADADGSGPPQGRGDRPQPPWEH